MKTKLNVTQNDFNSICRLCLNDDYQLKPIYLKSETNSSNELFDGFCLDEMIDICLGLHVRKNCSIIKIINIKIFYF